LYNAYQSTHGRNLESSLKSAKYLLSCIGLVPGQAVFAGLFDIVGHRPLSHKQYWSIPEYQELKELGMRGFTNEQAGERQTIEWFDLRPNDFYRQWIGKLTISWPPPERSWWRRAERNDFPVRAILEDNAFDEAMPRWDTLELTWARLSILPTQWANLLSQWRGVYLIFDESDGKRYVGSAYGPDNLLGRWQGYAKSGHGGNKLLKARDPKTFRFTILQRLSPDLPADEVMRIEASWKARLHTRTPHGLNEN
jgi:hypothetical protein